MKESRWICERCKRAFDLEEGEGWIVIAPYKDSSQEFPFQKVCYECTDELLAFIQEVCDKRCAICPVATVWRLSPIDCLRFQLKFDLIELPLPEQPPRGSLDEAKEILKIFNRF